MSAWTPRGFALTPASVVRVTASDAEPDEVCLQSTYAKSRRKSNVESPSGWRKRWDPDDFPLKILLDSLYVYFQSRARLTSDAAEAAAKAQYSDTHPGVRTFLTAVLENYLEFLEERERTTGSRLRYLGYEHSARMTARGELYVWAPAFSSETEPGQLEIHRLHLRSGAPVVSNWAVLAAHVLANRPRLSVEGVTVADVVLYHRSNKDAGEVVLLDRASPSEISALYADHVRPRVLELIAGGDPTPGPRCGDCKVVGVCDAMIQLDGALQQTEHGTHTRSISASNLNVYERCPARWLLEIKHKLPTELPDGRDQRSILRGQTVHAWLNRVHSRGRKCTIENLPPPEQFVPSEDGFDRDEYRLAYPFLLGHLESCPIDENMEVIHVDKSLYGWDSSADVAIAVKPDLIYVRQGVLIVRETKTTEIQPPSDADSARDSYDGIVYWLLSMLKFGLLKNLSCQDGAVQLEILSPGKSTLFTYPVSDPALRLISETRVRYQVAEWHRDRTWIARPGVQCASCPVSTWCPDRAPIDARQFGGPEHAF